MANQNSNTNQNTIIFEGTVFKAIPNFPNYYISRDGKVYSYYRNSLLTINYNNGAYKYPTVGFYVNGKFKCYPLHKAIALAWIPLPKGYTIDDVLDSYKNRTLVIDHIDGNKLNFDASNLRWCTPFENLMFNNYNRARRCEKLKGNQNAKGKKKSESTVRYEYYYDGKTYTLRELCKELKCSKSKITESFRRNLGLVKAGKITRKIKEIKIVSDKKTKIISEGLKKEFLAPREITEAEIEELYRSFKED